MGKSTKKVEKVESGNGYLGDSSQGGAIYAPGKHPKDRQLASKKELESTVVAPILPAEEPVEEVGHEEASTIETDLPAVE